VILAGKSAQDYTCTECGGYWIGREHLSTILSLDSLEAEPRDHDKGADLKAGLCPHGHGILIRARLDLDPVFYLDRCMTCNGVWFDSGEWERVAAAGLAQGLFELWSHSFRRGQRMEKARSEYLELMKQRLGENVFNGINELAGLLKDHTYQKQALAFLHEEIELLMKKKEHEENPPV
jgi:Zn-finger nucleic acid-binding protein